VFNRYLNWNQAKVPEILQGASPSDLRENHAMFNQQALQIS